MRACPAVSAGLARGQEEVLLPTTLPHHPEQHPRVSLTVLPLRSPATPSEEIRTELENCQE